MNKKTELNRIVKQKITDAVFSLMREKSFSDITVTEIIKTAGVARATFYRNYSTKESVVTTIIDEVLNQFADGKDYSEIDCMQFAHVEKALKMFREYGHYTLGLYNSGFATLYLERLNSFHEAVAGVMPQNSAEKYAVYIYMGALFNTAIKWLQGGCREEASEVAEVFCKQFGIAVTPSSYRRST